jgi:ABC-type transporter Mla subunit MlaD
VVICFALVIGVIVGIRGWGEFIEPTQKRVVQFELKDDIGGLSVGDDVRVGGYRVGFVRSIDILDRVSDEADPVIHVTFGIPRKLALRENASVRVQETLTGLSWLNFDSLGAGPELPLDEPLVGRSSPTAELLANLGMIVPEIQETIAMVRAETVPNVNQAIASAMETSDSFREAADEGRELLAQVRGHVDPVVEKVHIVADRSSETLVNMRDLFGDTGTDLRETAANVNRATGTLADDLPGITEQVSAFLANLDETVEGINGSMADIAATAENTRELTGAARSVLVRNRARIDSIMATVRTTSENLRGASAEIRRAPWRLLYRPRPGEMANVNLFESARQFAEGAGELHDAARTLRDALEDPTLEEQELQRMVDHVQQTFQNFHEVEQRLWTEVRQ